MLRPEKKKSPLIGKSCLIDANVHSSFLAHYRVIDETRRRCAPRSSAITCLRIPAGGSARIIAKEPASNEENPPNRICLPQLWRAFRDARRAGAQLQAPEGFSINRLTPRVGMYDEDMSHPTVRPRRDAQAIEVRRLAALRSGLPPRPRPSPALATRPEPPGALRCMSWE